MITGEQFPAELAGKANVWTSRMMEKVFGPGVHNMAFAGITWADIGILLCFLILLILTHVLTASFLRRKILRTKAESKSALWRFQILTTCSKPFYLLIWIYGLYFAASFLLTNSSPGESNSPIQQLFDKLLNFGVFFVVCWLFLRLTRILEARLLQWATKSESKLDDILIPLLGKTARVLIPVVAVILMLPIVGLPPSYSGIISKGSSLTIVGVIAWILFQIANATEQFVLGKYDIGVADNLQARKVHTQVKVISKTVYFIIGIFTVASALMTFEEVRRVGSSILASAGVLGLIVGFAAQKTIANLFAGFQLAMTQPIRLDDVVIVDSEWGRVEEITLT